MKRLFVFLLCFSAFVLSSCSTSPSPQMTETDLYEMELEIYNEAYQDGFDAGETHAYDSGFEDGYQEGWDDANSGKNYDPWDAEEFIVYEEESIYEENFSDFCSYDSSVSSDTLEEITVYITDTGEKYHRDGCNSLWNSQIERTLTEALSQGYAPCKNCSPPTQ